MPRIPVEQRRELLVAAAFRVIARNGVEAATTRGICAEASMSLASFHYAFESRDELLRAVVATALSAESDAVHAVLAVGITGSADAGSIADVLRGGMIGYLDSLVADPDREQALITLSGYARRTPGLTEFAENMYERYYELAALSLQTAADATGSRWRTPPATLAPVVVAATDGLTLAYLNTGDRGVAEQIIDSCVAMLLTHVESS